MHFYSDDGKICKLLIDSNDESAQLIGHFLDANNHLKDVRCIQSDEGVPVTLLNENACILNNFYPKYLALNVPKDEAHSIVLTKEANSVHCIGRAFSTTERLCLELKQVTSSTVDTSKSTVDASKSTVDTSKSAPSSPDSSQSQRKRAKLTRKNKKLDPIYVNSETGMKRYPSSLAHEAMQAYADKMIGSGLVEVSREDGKTKLLKRSRDGSGWVRVKTLVDLKEYIEKMDARSHDFHEKMLASGVEILGPLASKLITVDEQVEQAEEHEAEDEVEAVDESAAAAE